MHKELGKSFFEDTRKSSRLEDRKLPNINEIWDSLRSSLPELLACFRNRFSKFFVCRRLHYVFLSLLIVPSFLCPKNLENRFLKHAKNSELKDFFVASKTDFPSSLGIHAESEILPVLILGGGMGGLTSALYLGRGGIEATVIEGKSAGGALTSAHLVENWPGEKSISGSALIEKIREQAASYGARFLTEEVVEVDVSKAPFKVVTKGVLDQKTHERKAFSLIIAMGSTPKMLSIPGEREYGGKGVSFCAACDGAFYRGKKVVVIGSGDVAIGDAEYLSHLCEKVTCIVRKGSLRAKEIKRKEALAKKKNVEVYFNTQVVSIEGNGQNVTHIVVQNAEGKKTKLVTNGVFIAIGHTPNTELFQGKLDLSEEGYILLKHGQETSHPGVFAVGEIADPQFQQAITAAAEGARAALQAEAYCSSALSASSAKVQLAEKKSSYQMVEITSTEQFRKELKEFPGYVLVDFYATWCAPCQRLSFLLDQKIKNSQEKIKVLKVNVEQHLFLAEKYDVRQMPTLLIFDPDKNLVERKTGLFEILDSLSFLEKEGGSQKVK